MHGESNKTKFCGLFDDPVRSSDYIISNEGLIVE
jgi:hypothetical protein